MLCMPAVTTRKANGQVRQTAVITRAAKLLPPISQNGRCEVRCRSRTMIWFTAPWSRWNMNSQVMVAV